MKKLRAFYIKYFTRRAIVTDTEPGVIEKMRKEADERAELSKLTGEYVDVKPLK